MEQPFKVYVPGHFLEVRKLLPLLTAPGSDDSPSFHVVALSLPNFGFSEAPKKKGFGAHQYAEVMGILCMGSACMDQLWVTGLQ